MAIEFLDVQNKNVVLFKILDSETSFYIDIIQKFNEKFNDLFDIYGDFRLYQNHIDKLIELAEITQKEGQFNFEKFRDFLFAVKENNKTLLIIGN